MDRIEIEVTPANGTLVLHRRKLAPGALRKPEPKNPVFSTTKTRRLREGDASPQDEPEPIAASRDGWRDNRYAPN
jgi:hypothetical protein